MSSEACTRRGLPISPSPTARSSVCADWLKTVDGALDSSSPLSLASSTSSVASGSVEASGFSE